MRRRLCAVVATCMLMACALGVLAGCSSAPGYVPEEKTPTVSTPTIGVDGTLRVGVNTKKSPLAGMSTEKAIIGLDVDVAAALADEMGLKLSIVDVGSDPQSALAAGDVDIVMGIDNTESAENLWLSSSYLPTGIALFALSSSNAQVPTADLNPQIAVQLSTKSSWAVSGEFGDDALTVVVDLKDAFAQLEQGSVQYVASDAVVGLYSAHRQDLDVSFVALLSKAGGYCVGVAQDNAQLQSEVSAALSTLVNGGVVDIIESKWFGQVIDLSDVALTAKAASSGAATQVVADDADGNADADGDADASSADDASDVDYASGVDYAGGSADMTVDDVNTDYANSVDDGAGAEYEEA